MTYSVVHQCPKCELRFSFRSELEYHLNADHPVPAAVERTSAKPAEPASPGTLLATPPVATAVDTARPVDARRRLPLVGLLLAVAAVLLVAYAAVVVSVSTTVIIAVAALLVVAIYARRYRGWPRVPRR